MGLGNVNFVFVAIKENDKLASLVVEEVKSWNVTIVKNLHKADTIISNKIRNDWFVAKKVQQVVLVGISKPEFLEAQKKWQRWTNLVHLTFF